MEKVVLDSDLQAKLNGSELELVDRSGQTVGYFLPPQERERLKRLEAENQHLLIQWGFSQLSPEQLDAVPADEKLYTTEEVLKYLESL
jgi:hypothetical protein